MSPKLPWDCLPLREFLDFLDAHNTSADDLSEKLNVSIKTIRNMAPGDLLEEMDLLMKASKMDSALCDIETMFRNYRKYEDLPTEQMELIERMTKELREILEDIKT